MKTAHTPGPWTSDTCYVRSALPEAGDADIARIYQPLGMKPATRVANAALIAAAPDLLAALKEIVAGDQPNGGTFSGSQCVEIAQAAIAKAEAA